MDDWNEYVQEPTNDVANYYNVGNYDGKALRMILSLDTPLVQGDVACLAD